MADDEKIYRSIFNSIKEVGQLFDEIINTQDKDDKKIKYNSINEKVKVILTNIKDIKENNKNLYSKYKIFKRIDTIIRIFIEEKKANKKGYVERFRIEIKNLITKIKKVEEDIDRLKCSKAPEERQELKDETFMETYERNLIFFYSKFKQTPIPLNKKRLTPNEKKELMNAIHSYTDKNDLEKMSEDLFHTKINDFNSEFSKYENNNGLLNAGTNYRRCSFPIGRTFSGFMSILLKSEKQLRYSADYSNFICPTNSNKCITIAVSLESYSNLPNEGKTKNYIIVNEKYFPESSNIPINVMYDKLPLISFITDAFFNNGIVDIEPQLKERIENDYPELYYGPHPENKGKNNLKLNSTTSPLNNSLRILNTNGPELRIRKRIGTIRKKISTVKSLASALKKGGRRTRKSRK